MSQCFPVEWDLTTGERHSLSCSRDVPSDSALSAAAIPSTGFVIEMELIPLVWGLGRGHGSGSPFHMPGPLMGWQAPTIPSFSVVDKSAQPLTVALLV